MKKKKVFIIIAIVLGALLLSTAAFVISTAMMLDLSKITNVSQNTVLYDAGGNEVSAISGAENRTLTKLSDIPGEVQLAFIAAEDARFYEHHGVDLWRIGGALIHDIKTGGYAQGASTITQQLVKLTHLTSDKTVLRKLREAVLAITLETKLSKNEILESYLNTIYFGNGAYGLEAASKTYFSKSASQLTIDEGALLAAIIKAPSNYSPDANPENAKRRRDLVLDNMASYEFISQSTADELKAKPITLAMKTPEAFSHGYYVDAVLEEAEDALNISSDELLTGGYHIYTSLDVAMQTSAESLFQNSKNFPANASDGTQAQSALVASNPENGEIMALIGGRKYEIRRGFNRATQMKRQPGSAIKPISVYAAAIDKYHYLPSNIIDDTKREFAGGYSPRNSGNVYHGKVTLREALARSMNVATVDLLSRIDISVVRGYIEKAGITLDRADSNYSLALGSLTYGVSPAELAAAYAPLANGGTSVTPHTIREIRDSAGQTVYRYKDSGQRVMSEESAYMITDMLKSAATWGSASALSALSFSTAGKTGTVSMEGGGNRDAWTVAYTPSLTVCVWMGYDQPDSKHRLSDTSGGSAEPARLSASFLKANTKTATKKSFKRPSGLTEALIDQKALKTLYKPMLASELTPKSQVIRELFPVGQAPTEVSNIWTAPTAPLDFSVAEVNGVPRISVTVANDYALYLIHRKSDDDDEVVSALDGLVGETVYYSDMQADLSKTLYYYAVPVNKELYAEGKMLAGEPSALVRFRPKNKILEFIEDNITSPAPTPSPTAAPTPVTTEKPAAYESEEAQTEQEENVEGFKLIPP